MSTNYTSQFSKKTKVSAENSSGASNAEGIEEMIRRWIKLIQTQVPNVDLIDISAEVRVEGSAKR